MLQRVDKPMHHGILIAAVHLHPAGVLKSLFHLFLASDQGEVHHVSEIALLVLHSSGNRSEDRGRYGGGDAALRGRLVLRLLGLARQLHRRRIAARSRQIGAHVDSQVKLAS